MVEVSDIILMRRTHTKQKMVYRYEDHGTNYKTSIGREAIIKGAPM